MTAYPPEKKTAGVFLKIFQKKRIKGNGIRDFREDSEAAALMINHR